MRLLAFSDLHRNQDCARAIALAAERADLVVGAGDFTTMRRGMSDTIDILRSIEAPTILVAGNHDSLDDLRAACRDWPQAQVLHGEATRIGGLIILGLGFEIASIDRGAWNSQMSETEAEHALAGCPAGAILVTHAPPHGVADHQANGQHDGSHAIRAAIESRRPRLHLCGHIHNAWGTRGMIGSCPVHNLGPSINWFEI